jgi:hypothetical protein
MSARLIGTNVHWRADPLYELYEIAERRGG